MFMVVCLFRTFSDAPTETLHTQKNRQIFFEPEKDFWMIMVSFLSLSTSSEFCCLLMIFTNSLDPNQARQNVGPDLDPNCLTL